MMHGLHNIKLSFESCLQNPDEDFLLPFACYISGTPTLTAFSFITLIIEEEFTFLQN
jgi:hypothetical protein